MPRPHNVILTGIPRSGTTLTAAIIDGFANSVCLNEPRWQADWATQHPKISAEDYVKWLTGDYIELRRKLLAGEPIEDRRDAQGKAVTNYFMPPAKEKKREKVFHLTSFVRPGLSPDFLLASKHNGLYAGVLCELLDTGFFTAIAIIRHPAHAIASWRSLDFPISRGHMPAAERFWPQMRALAQSDLDLLQKHVGIYDLLCERFYQQRDRIHIVRYEDLIERPELIGHVLQCKETSVSLPIRKQKTDFYKELDKITAAVKRYGSHYRHFYPDL